MNGFVIVLTPWNFIYWIPYQILYQKSQAIKIGTKRKKSFREDNWESWTFSRFKKSFKTQNFQGIFPTFHLRSSSCASNTYFHRFSTHWKDLHWMETFTFPPPPILKTYFHKFSHRGIRFGKLVFIRSLKVRFVLKVPQNVNQDRKTCIFFRPIQKLWAV